VYSGVWAGVHRYVLSDSSGTDYRLDVNTAGVWTSSKEGFSGAYDAAAGKLYFPGGSFWVMGCVSPYGTGSSSRLVVIDPLSYRVFSGRLSAGLAKAGRGAQ
jgi:hypothetical protein